MGQEPKCRRRTTRTIGWDASQLPMPRVKHLELFLDFELAASETTWIRKFRACVRERFVPEKT